MKLTFFLQELNKLKECIEFEAKINTPLPDSKQTLKEIYQAAKSAGLPSPLDNPPTYPNYLKEIRHLFYDIINLKTEFDTFLSLTHLDLYQKLFEVKISPYLLKVIINLDRAHTIAINEILKRKE